MEKVSFRPALNADKEVALLGKALQNNGMAIETEWRPNDWIRSRYINITAHKGSEP